MTKNYVATLILCFSIGQSFSQTDTSSHLPFTHATSIKNVDLPRCINSADDIVEIQRAQKVNPKSALKYQGYRNILNTDTDVELVTRLAYAETIAANCPEQADQIVELVTSVIGNRVRIRDGDIKSVVFQRDQFASSLNIYAESRYRDFLCPKHLDLWNKTRTKMHTNLAASKPTAPIPADTVNYYLYRHSERFNAPDWKLEEAVVADEKTRDCIRVFRNPAWK